nr:uncharacterized protein LOC124810111 [Hydra vulgaris]
MNELHSNFLSLHNMLIETTKLLRQKFLYSFKEIYNIEWADKKENDFFINGGGKEIRSSCNKIQKTILDSGCSNEWDVTLLCTILSSKLFLRKNLYSSVLIQKISSVRNRICHLPTLEITDTSFDELSNELTPLMSELGASKEYVLELKNNKGFQASQVEQDKNAQFFKESANEEFKIKNYEQAIKIYTSAILLRNLTNQELGILYRNRSLSYLKLYEKTKNAINLDYAIADAKKTCFYQPVWFKGYAQLGAVYQKLNELKKAVKYYEKHLAFNLNNDEVKNTLASLKVKLEEQYRNDHFINLPLSIEEQDDQLAQEFQKIFPNSRNFNHFYSKQKKMFFKEDPILKLVWTGHEYRDGSKNVKQNYEITAKYYSEAAKSNNAEGIFSLACLMMSGLGVKKDFEAALSLLNEAAKQEPTRKLMGFEIPNDGVKEAEHKLGLLYQEGTYVPKNILVASYWYQLAIEHGNPQSANNLGLFYLHGNGVPKNILQAKKLFLFAHENGVVTASSNLVSLYLQELDADRALEWHEIALQKLYLSKMEDGNIRKLIENIKNAKNLKDYNEVLLPIQKYVKRFENSLLIPSAILVKTKRFNIEELRLNSKNGSITASQMLKAYNLFHSALHMLQNENFIKEDFVRMLATAFICCHIICQFSNIIQANVLKIVNSIIHENNNQKTDIDYFARICFAYLNGGDYTLGINFLTSSLKIYPGDAKMLHLLGCNFSFLYQYENALKAFESACLSDPLNYEYIFSKAAVLRLLKNCDAKHFYEKFISVAPVDHRMIPESYYGIGLCFVQMDQDFSKYKSEITFYYKKGLENENLQLSCFLPYESNSKVCIESWLNVSKLDPKKLTESLPETVEPSNKSNNLFVDYKRKETIINHRKMFDMVEENENEYVMYCNITYKPLHTQTVPSSIVGLKKVFFEDIDFTKDHLLTGRVLTVTNINIPMVNLFTSVHFVVEDENEIVARLCINNLGKDYQLINNMFPVGCIFSVIDPYVRLAADGKPMIRVDDPNSIIMSEKFKINMCLYCGKEKSKYTCSKCKIAKYCTKECQYNDWKFLKHKSVCYFLSCKQ